MLLFFIAQLTAFADVCNLEKIETSVSEFTIYMCHHGFKKEMLASHQWWNSQGYNLKLADGYYDCDRDPDEGEIFVEFNDSMLLSKEPSKKGRSVYALTVRTHNQMTGYIDGSNIYLSTELIEEPDELKTFIRHELGHALGYDHTNESCHNHVMNPLYRWMGYKI